MTTATATATMVQVVQPLNDTWNIVRHYSGAKSTVPDSEALGRLRLENAEDPKEREYAITYR